MDSDSFIEPMPFFRTDPRIRTTTRPTGSPRSSLPPTNEEPDEILEERRSVASSGVLGPGTTEVDLDTEFESSDDDVSTSTDSSYDQLVRNISTVRRGQARIVRNPSARKSMVPEVWMLQILKLTLGS
jgi:hypothetical protein